MDLKEIESLIKLLEETALTEIEVEENGRRIRVRKEPAPPARYLTASHHEASFMLPSVSEKSNLSQGEGPSRTSQIGPGIAKETDDHLVVIRSPIVGTFYAAHAQGADTYVKVGDVVKKGQTLCIVEAMKLMNEIESDLAGTVAVICVEDKSSVEFGQPLFKIEPAA
jgi:acetyl-CoA carboxylase biotin carboxyl carrier protein